MTTSKSQSWAYAEEFAHEDEATAAARSRARELGVPAVSAGVGSALRAIARMVSARTVAEVGTGAGVSGLWLLAGMGTDGVLTTIDAEPEHQRAARESFTAAGLKPARTRLIGGRAREVLPRLADGAYDLVHLDGDPDSSLDDLDQAVKLLRPGGVLAVHAALWRDRVADPARRDEDTVAMREVGKSIRADERLVSTLIPAGDGLLVGVRV
nr:O-methyltransferase [Bogoriella caseilytica]